MPRQPIDTITAHPFDRHIRTMADRAEASQIAREVLEVMEKHQCSLGLGMSLLSAMVASAIGAEVTRSTERRELTAMEMAHALNLADEVRNYIERQLVDWGEFGAL